MFKFILFILTVFIAIKPFAKEIITEVTYINPKTDPDKLNILKKFSTKDLTLISTDESNPIPFNKNLFLKFQHSDITWMFKGEHDLLLWIPVTIIDKYSKKINSDELIIHCPTLEEKISLTSVNGNTEKKVISKNYLVTGKLYSKILDSELDLQSNIDINHQPSLKILQAQSNLLCSRVEFSMARERLIEAQNAAKKRTIDEVWETITK